MSTRFLPVLLGFTMTCAMASERPSERQPANNPRPFKLTIDKKRGDRTGKVTKGYDAQLPGYRVAGGIVYLKIQAQIKNLPDKLVFAIQTPQGKPSPLSRFALTSPHLKVEYDAGSEYRL